MSASTSTNILAMADVFNVRAAKRQASLSDACTIRDRLDRLELSIEAQLVAIHDKAAAIDGGEISAERLSQFEAIFESEYRPLLERTRERCKWINEVIGQLDFEQRDEADRTARLYGATAS